MRRPPPTRPCPNASGGSSTACSRSPTAPAAAPTPRPGASSTGSGRTCAPACRRSASPPPARRPAGTTGGCSSSPRTARAQSATCGTCSNRPSRGTDRADERIETIDGLTGGARRREIQRRFNADPTRDPLRILLATDAAREGLNFQAHCADLFHFDLPWNPGRIEQRNGRIDRKLQPAPEVRCHYFVLPQRAEDRVLEVLVHKTGTIKAELGSLSKVIDDDVERRLNAGGIRHSDAARLAREIDAADVEAERRRIAEDELEAARERQGALHGQVERCRDLLDRSRRWVGFEAPPFRDALSCSLDLLGAEPLRPGSDRRGNPVWTLPPLDPRAAADPSWTATLDTLRAPRKADQKLADWRRDASIRPVVFEDPGVLGDDAVHLHLGQRVAQRLLARFRAQGFVYHDLSRACLAQAADAVPRMVLLGRLSLYRRGAERLHEEIVPVAARWIEPSRRTCTCGTGDDFDRAGRAVDGLDASPHGRLERLLRHTGVPAGLLFNGVAVRLVSAPRGESSGWLDFRVADMLETSGRPIAAALRLLLGQTRLLLAPRGKGLAALLADSRRYQNDVSERLAEQVLHALYDLLRGLQAAHDASRGALLRKPLAEGPDEIYRAALAVLLRLVFLLYAEQRDMLPDDDTFRRAYSPAALYERLREDAALHPDTMDQRYGAWPQLVALFRIVHDGAAADGLTLPPRRGALFDPDRYPFLEGRTGDGARQVHERIEPPLVPEGTVYRVLDKLLVLGGERVSYRALDVEHIGSVYETMMGFRLETAAGRSLAVRAAKKTWRTSHREPRRAARGSPGSPREVDPGPHRPQADRQREEGRAGGRRPRRPARRPRPRHRPPRHTRPRARRRAGAAAEPRAAAVGLALHAPRPHRADRARGPRAGSRPSAGRTRWCARRRSTRRHCIGQRCRRRRSTRQ